LPWHGLCTRTINTYDFRSMMCCAIVSGWDLRRKDLDYTLARRLVHQWEEIAPNYFGDFYPLTPYSLQNDSWMAWQFDRPEAGEGMIQVFRRRDSSEKSQLLKLQGLAPGAVYTVSDIDSKATHVLRGRQLMEQGLSIHIPQRPGAVVMTYRKAAAGPGTPSS
jgi:alpha-galactosidase